MKCKHQWRVLQKTQEKVNDLELERGNTHLLLTCDECGKTKIETLKGSPRETI